MVNGLLSAVDLFSSLALLVVVAALVGLGVAFLMAGRDRPAARRSATGRVAILETPANFDWRVDPDTPFSQLPPFPSTAQATSVPSMTGPAPEPEPVVTHPDDPDFLLVSTEGPRASDELLSLPGLGASASGAQTAPAPIAARAPVVAPAAPTPVPPVDASVPVRAMTPEPLESPLRLEPAPLPVVTPSPRPLDRIEPDEPPAPSAPQDLSMHAVDRYALLRRIESLEERTDAHSRAWAKSLRARLESGRP